MHTKKQKPWFSAYKISRKSIFTLLCLLPITLFFSSAAISKSKPFIAGPNQLEQTTLATATAIEEIAATSTPVATRTATRAATRTPRSTATRRVRATSTVLSTIVPSGAVTSTATYTPPPSPTATRTPLPTATRREPQGANASIYIESLQLRSAPSESSEVVGGVVNGKSYRVLNISTDGIWIRLAVDNLPGGWGWVPARYTSVNGDITGIAISNDSNDEVAVRTETESPDRSAALPGDAVVTTNGSRLRVRSAPSGDADIIDHVYDGDAHRVLERSTNGRWVRLALDDNPEGGWVSVSYVKLGVSAPAPGQVAQAIAEPTSTPVFAATNTPTPQNTPTPVVPTPTWTAIAAQPAEAIGVAIVRTTGGSRLRVRAEPNTTAQILGYAYSDRSYNILQKNPTGSWVQISVSGLSTPGWVSVDFLDITFR